MEASSDKNGTSTIVPNVTTTTSSHHNETTDDERNEELAVVEVAISATIIFLAVVGNSVVVVSLAVKKSSSGKLSRMHLMMLHLSLADLSVAFFQVLPQMVWDITDRFQGGAFLCDTVKYLQLVTMYASAYVLLSTAVDRYVAICKPFLSQKWTSSHAHLLVLCAWLASLLFSLPQIYIFSMAEVESGLGVYDCWASFHPPWTLQLYVTWNVLSLFFAPCLLLAVLYSRISLAVWHSSKMAETLAPRYLAHAVPDPPGQRSVLSSHSWRNSSRSSSKRAPGCPGCPDFASTPLSDGRGPFCSSALCGPQPSSQGHTEAQRSSPADSVDLIGNTGTDRSSPSEVRALNCVGSGLPEHAGHPCSVLQLQEMSCNGVTRRPETPLSNHCGVPAPGPQPHEARCPSSGRPSGPPTTLPLSSAVQQQQQQYFQPASSFHPPPTALARGKVRVGISRAKIKTIKLTLTVVICYLVCWTPYYVAQLWAAYDQNVPYDNIFFTVVLLLASVNSCTNPWIYLAFSDTIWATLRGLLLSLPCCRRCCCCAPTGPTYPTRPGGSGRLINLGPRGRDQQRALCKSHHGRDDYASLRSSSRGSSPASTLRAKCRNGHSAASVV